MQRFDEIELTPVPLIEEPPALSVLPVTRSADEASRFRRLLALLTDLSLFVALALALLPLLPLTRNMASIVALGGFVVMTSYYYFAGTWLLWGKTVGGAIFDVKVVATPNEAMSVKAASLRWAGLSVSLLTGGLGFLLAWLPSRRSLADRLSQTRCITAV
jgi:uncharacterized RDD family membrane protein YckC